MFILSVNGLLLILVSLCSCRLLVTFCIEFIAFLQFRDKLVHQVRKHRTNSVDVHLLRLEDAVEKDADK